ncbi:MAG: RnfABCDGE type electron transport complex subunit B [Deltaproteobacteria bacterium]|nr:RnfABCDGE type electron transport complex subunit B [Deltaproteobacteria bacterium]
MSDMILIIAVLTMGGLGLFFAIGLAIASKKLKVKEDPRVKKVMEILPMTNCGACGVPGCSTFAVGLVKGDIAINACVAGGQEVADLLAKALGIDSATSVRMLAVVLCRGGDKETRKFATYRGDKTCASADLTGGEKSCSYSCLGLSDCVVSCEFGAMEMNDNGLPVVFYDKCIGCGACAKACPRDIIEMHSESMKVFVYCKNKDKGPIAKKHCDVACIGCGLCVKDCNVEGGIVMKNNLAVINYESCPQDDSTTKRCPTKCILFDEEPKQIKEVFSSKAMKVASGS